jgi:hypothetical protein
MDEFFFQVFWVLTTLRQTRELTTYSKLPHSLCRVSHPCFVRHIVSSRAVDNDGCNAAVTRVQRILRAKPAVPNCNHTLFILPMQPFISSFLRSSNPGPLLFVKPTTFLVFQPQTGQGCNNTSDICSSASFGYCQTTAHVH